MKSACISEDKRSSMTQWQLISLFPDSVISKVEKETGSDDKHYSGTTSLEISQFSWSVQMRLRQGQPLLKATAQGSEF